MSSPRSWIGSAHELVVTTPPPAVRGSTGWGRWALAGAPVVRACLAGWTALAHPAQFDDGVFGMSEDRLFARLVEINQRPQPFARDTVEQLWTDPHRAEQMLRSHLDGSVDVSSRRTAFIEKSVRWISDTFELAPGKAVADLGCGPGLYTNRLALTGAAVVGVDF